MTTSIRARRSGGRGRVGAARVAAAPPESHVRIQAVVRRIPRGSVATYGQVAELAGLPRHARLVGHVMRSLPADTAVPWHRVVNARGQISRRGDLGGEQIQPQLLRREGVRFAGETIPLERYLWKPPVRGMR